MTSEKVVQNPGIFFMKTPMLIKLHECIRQWVWCGAIGGFIIGESRAGKTFAIMALLEWILSRIGEKIPICLIIAEGRDNNTIADMMRIVVSSLELNCKTRAPAGEMSDAIIRHLRELAYMNSEHKVIMIVDNVEKFGMKQLSVFSDFYNRLFKDGINLIVIFVADRNKSKKLIDELLQDENKNIKERFFNQVHEFYGIRTQEELNQCLKLFDSYNRNGERKKPSMTEQYMPQAYKEGWRLSSLSDLVWEAFCTKYKARLKLDSLCMVYFARFADVMLKDYLPNYDYADQDVMEDIIKNSFKASDIIPTLTKFD